MNSVFEDENLIAQFKENGGIIITRKAYREQFNNEQNDVLMLNVEESSSLYKMMGSYQMVQSAISQTNS
jgi:hypothetical protein